MAVVIGAGGRHIPAETRRVAHPRPVRRQRLHRARVAAPGWTVDLGQELRRHVPVGPSLVTPDELDWHDAAIRTIVSGEEMQSARTSQ